LSITRLCAVLLFLLFANPARAEQTAPLSLNDLLRAALAHDGRVLAAHAELNVYRAKYDEASWLWFPVIKLQGLIGGPVSERRLLDCDPTTDPLCTGVGVTDASKGGDFDLGNMSIAMGGKIEGIMPIYTFGKISEAKKAAQAGVRASEAGIDRARQEVALEVRRAYYGWLLSTSAVEILEDGENKVKAAEKKLIKMLDELNEDVTDRDLFKLRYYASQVKSMLVRARKGRAITLAALRFLTGINDLGTKRKLVEQELTALEFKEEPRETYLARARRQRPELKMLMAAIDAHLAGVELQKASFYPDFFLGGYFKGSWSPVHDFIENPLLNAGLTSYDAGLAVGFQITFDIPLKLARLEQARAQLSKTQVQSGQAELAVKLEIDKCLEDMREAISNNKIQRKGHRSAKAWMRANWMSYGIGISDTKDLLDSIAAYAVSKIELDKAKHNILVAIDKLHAACGDNLSKAP